jgi:hypothetical protein
LQASVLFPPGCYGSYLIRCIYNYTNLRKEEYVPFSFDSSGSSHVIRKSLSNKYFKGYHKTTLPNGIAPSIIILPDTDHKLDYFNNQFAKQSLGQLKEYLMALFSKDELNKKINDRWSSQFDSICTWSLREFISFWLNDVLNDSYNPNFYIMYDGFKITTQDIFLNFVGKIQEIIEHLKLSLTVDINEIQKNHESFKKYQQYHKSQLNCKTWLDLTLSSNANLPSPCLTIFDEAYVQFLLREKGYELQCYNLNTFVSDSNSLRAIINAS